MALPGLGGILPRITSSRVAVAVPRSLARREYVGNSTVPRAVLSLASHTRLVQKSLCLCWFYSVLLSCCLMTPPGGQRHALRPFPMQKRDAKWANATRAGSLQTQIWHTVSEMQTFQSDVCTHCSPSFPPHSSAWLSSPLLPLCEDYWEVMLGEEKTERGSDGTLQISEGLP